MRRRETFLPVLFFVILVHSRAFPKHVFTFVHVPHLMIFQITLSGFMFQEADKPASVLQNHMRIPQLTPM